MWDTISRLLRTALDQTMWDWHCCHPRTTESWAIAIVCLVINLMRNRSRWIYQTALLLEPGFWHFLSIAFSCMLLILQTSSCRRSSHPETSANGSEELVQNSVRDGTSGIWNTCQDLTSSYIYSLIFFSAFSGSLPQISQSYTKASSLVGRTTFNSRYNMLCNNELLLIYRVMTPKQTAQLIPYHASRRRAPRRSRQRPGRRLRCRGREALGGPALGDLAVGLGLEWAEESWDQNDGYR